MSGDQVLGLDPSKTGLGWALLGARADLIDYGFIAVEVVDEDPGEFAQICALALKVGDLVVKHAPVQVFAERAFDGNNRETAALLHRLAGALALAVRIARPSGPELMTIPPARWHKLVDLKPDIYPTGRVTPKTKKPKVRHDYKAPAMRLAYKLWPACATPGAPPLIEAAADAALIGLAGLRDVPIPF